MQTVYKVTRDTEEHFARLAVRDLKLKPEDYAYYDVRANYTDNGDVNYNVVFYKDSLGTERAAEKNYIG